MRLITQNLEEVFVSEPEGIEAYGTQLRAKGWCAVPGVIPGDRIDALREHVVQGH